jgi:outer membrane protein insertion porin family
MKKLKLLSRFFIVFFLILNFSNKVYSKEFFIKGNKFTDKEVIVSIIGIIPDLDEKSKSNFILKELNKSGLFKSVNVSVDDKFYYIDVIEYPTINKIFYSNNKRIKDDQIDQLIADLKIISLSNKNISNLVDELKIIYNSFGYNNIKINTKIDILANSSADFYLDFKEGSLTKINKINFIGNKSFKINILNSKIKSKTKKLSNILANNNFKLFEIKNDILRLTKFYRSKGFADVNIDYNVEFFKNNKVIVNFIIEEGPKYFFSTFKINNNLDNNSNINNNLDLLISENNLFDKNSYNYKTLDKIESEIATILTQSGVQFFNIQIYEKATNQDIDILIEISKTNPIYLNQINIFGNTRTYDYVIRRELDLVEGDPINDTKIKKVKKTLNQISFFKNVDVKTSLNQDNTKDLDISVEETQTGSFNVGFSIGTLDGVSFVSGLKERNINGTGRSLEFLINTSDNNKEFTLSTSEKFVFNNKVVHKYATKYKENDFSNSKSYKLNTLIFESDFSYLLADDFYHTLGIGYELKDYIITNASSVSKSIDDSSGQNIAFNFKNELAYNDLNSFIRPSNGNYIGFSNFVQTPSSSNNGYIKNILILKKYLESNSNVYSIQTKIGNVSSLSNIEILSDNKFSLGGRWLRGFDNFGAGPRNSRTNYVGGNNLIVTKFDFSRPLTLNDQNPIYLNIFNDYGLIWGNKDNISFSDNQIRASYGFGLNFYSPIGPIGFSWGFPLSDKEYDIKRMFMFTIGNLN